MCQRFEYLYEIFLKYLICQDGVSKKVLTDQYANFTGTLMKIVARKFNIKQYRILVYYLQSNLQSNMGRLMRSLP
ncbi:enzymatic polyprotein endonuclease reverse, partial [Vespula maculifrons]